MSNSVDDKIIKVSLDDAQFQKSIDAVIKALGDLKKSLDIAGSAKGLEDLSSAANKIKFDGAVDSAGDLQKSVSKATDSATEDLADLGSSAQKSMNAISTAADNVSLSDIGTAADKASDQVVNASAQANAAIGKIGTNTSGIEQAADGIQNISKAAQNVDVSPVQKACSSINSSLSSVGEAASSVFGKFGNNIDTSKITGAIASAQSAVDNFSTSNMASQIDAVAVKFSAFQAIALGAMTAIGAKAVELGQNAMQSMVAGAKGGLEEYETQLNSVQTILANTSRYGTTVGQVNDALGVLNTYADKTIYSFSDMTKNIGLFTNAGLRVEDATTMIKGFSNAAAASGANAQATAGAAYQLSQALTTGEIRLMDWRSLTNAGMGSKNMQDDIINIANAMGTLGKVGLKTTDVQANFNDSLQKGWLTTDVMSNYLKIMSGDMDDAGMAALGLSREQIDGLKKTAATAQDAATKTKSFSQMMGQYSEAIGSGWSTTWQLVFGDFEEAKNNWTGLNDMLQNMASNSAKARNDILKVWHDKGGQKELFGTLNDGLKVLDTVLSSVKKGFAEVFPKKDLGSTLYDMTVALHKFVNGLLLSEDAQKRVTSVAKVFAYILKGLLTVLGVAFKVVQVFAEAIGFLVGIIFKGISAIVDWVVAFKQYIVETGIAQKVTDLWKQTFGNLISAVNIGVDGFKKFFGIMSSGFAKGTKDYPNLMKILGDALLGVSEAAANAGARFQDAVQRKMAPAMDLARKAASKIQSAMEAIKPVLDWLGGKIKLVGSEIKRFFGDLNGDITLSNILGIFNSAFAATLLINLNKLVKGFIKGGKELSSNTISDGIKSVLSAITDSFKDFQKSLSVGRLVAIAGAIALLTYSLIQLSSVEPEKIAIGLSGLAGVFTTLIGSMLTLASFGAKVNKLGVKAFNFDVLNQMALATVAMGGAIYLIAKAAVLLKDVDPVQLTIIFGLIDSLMLSMSASFAIIGKIKPATLTALSVALKGIGTGFVLMASSLVILAFAIAKIATVDPARLGPAMLAIAAGLGSMVAALTAIALVSKGTGADFEGISKSIVAMAASLVLMSFAISMLAKLDNGQLARGLIGVAAGLILLSGAMAAIGLIQGYGGGWEKSAASIIAMAFALNLMVIPIKTLGEMDIASLAKGVVGVAVALAAMAGAMALMGKFGGGSKSLVGASAAIISFAAALTLLMIPIKIMAKMNFNSLAQGLGGLILIMGSMVVAINALNTTDLGKVSVGLIAFAGSMIIMATAMKIMGSMDIQTLLTAFVGLAGILLALQTAGIMLGPFAGVLLTISGAVALFGVGLMAAGIGMSLFAAGIVALSGATSAAGGIITGTIDALIMAIPALVQSLVNALDGVLKVFAAALPSLLKSLTSILRQVTDWMVQQVPMLAEAALTMIDEVLKKIAAHAPSITDSLVVILVAALNAVANHAPEITAALGNVMNAIFTALGNAIRDADPGKFAAMLISMGVMALIFKSMAKMKKDVVGALLVGGTILLLMTGLVGVFALMNALNVKEALPNALAMATVFSAMTLVFDIMAAMKSSVPGALIVGGSIILLLAGLSLVFGLMSAMHVTDVLPTALAMSAVMLAMSAVIVILGAIPISMGLTAIANMAIFIAGLAAVVAAAGAIAQIPGVKWLVSEGASFLASLGKALGGFVGSIVGGALEGVSNSLPTVATNLSTFMTNLGPFIEGAKKIDQSVLDSAGIISQVILALSASNLMNAITGWVTGSSDFSQLSTNLVQFGSAMVNFANTTANLNVAAVTQATIAGRMLTSLQNSIPASGGLLQAFTGEKDWSSLSTGLVTLGKALTDYGNAVANLNATAILASIPAVRFLTAVQGTLQNTDGIFQAFTGDKDWGSLGKNLGKLGEALVDYGEWASIMSTEAILASVPAVKAVIGLQNSLGNSGGVAGWLFGDQDLSGLAKNLGQLGEGLYDYYQNVVNVSFDAVITSVSAVKKLVGMLQSLSGDYSGVGAFKTAIESAGDLGLASFAAKVSAASAAAGSAVKDLGTKLTDGNAAVASGVSALQATMASASFASSIGSSLNAASQAVSYGTTSIENNLNGLNGFVSGFGGRIGSSFGSFGPAVSSAMTSANSAIQGGSSMIQASLGSLSSFVSSYGGTFRASFNPIIASASSGMDAVKNAINSYRGPFQSAANNSAGGVKEGMKSGVGNLSGIFDSAIEKSVSAVRQYRGSFEAAGNYIAQGLANGISAGSSSAVNAAAKMGADAVSAAKEASGVNSPSKLTYAIGDFVTQGLANGIDDNSKKAIRSSKNMGASVISALNATMDKLALDPNYLSPKITPVIDTSNISSGLSSAFSATRSVGIRSKLDIGGIDYQDHRAIADAQYQEAMNQANASLVSNMSDLRNDMSKYTDAIENQELAMYLDGRKLASSQAKYNNQELGKLSRRSEVR